LGAITYEFQNNCELRNGPIPLDVAIAIRIILNPELSDIFILLEFTQVFAILPVISLSKQ